MEPGQGDPAQPTFGKHGWQNPACLIPKNAQTKGEATTKGGMPPDTTAVGWHNMSPPRGRQPRGRRGNANEKKKKNEGDDKCMKTQNECCCVLCHFLVNILVMTFTYGKDSINLEEIQATCIYMSHSQQGCSGEYARRWSVCEEET